MFEVADQILEAMTRIWGNDRVIKARSFAVSRDLMSCEEAKSAFPMTISQVMASKGWTEKTFIKSLY
jgi:hypothetical protein